MNATDNVKISEKKEPKEYLRLPYARLLVPESEGGFSAEIVEFPGCVAQGETATEALQNLEEVAECWIEAAQEQGQDIPVPTANQPYAGRIALRLPRDLHRQAVRKAQRDETSLNQCLVTAVAAWVGADNLFERMAEKVHQSQMNLVQIAISIGTSPGYVASYHPTEPSFTTTTAAITGEITTGACIIVSGAVGNTFVVDNNVLQGRELLGRQLPTVGHEISRRTR